MTIEHNNPPLHVYVSTGSIVAMPYEFRLFDLTAKSDMVIQVGSAIQSNDDFTITGGETDAGGHVTPLSAIPAGTVVVIRRKTNLERITGYAGAKSLRINVMELDADRMIAALQEHAEELGRAVKMPASGDDAAVLDLPDPVANRALKWNAAANGFENTDQDLDALGDAVETNKEATDTALAGAVAAQGATQALLSQVQALTVTAQNSAAAAEAALQAFPSGKVKRISADYQIPVGENGYHYVLDGTGDDIDLSAPLGSEALEPFRFSAQRLDSSDNTVRIVAAGDNTFNAGQTQIILPYSNSGASLALDIDPEPDNWSVATSGALSQLQETIYYFTATGGQTVFTGLDDFNKTLGFVAGRVEVYRGPVRLWKERGDYSDSSGDAVVMAEGMTAGEEITFVARSAFSVAGTLSVAEVEAMVNGVPVGDLGDVKPVMRTTAPNGWVAAAGECLLVASYPDFVTACYVGDTDNATAHWFYRCTDNADPDNTRSTTGDYIKLPDLNGSDGVGGLFLRGFNPSDPMLVRKWATLQEDAFKEHRHLNGMPEDTSQTFYGGEDTGLPGLTEVSTSGSARSASPYTSLEGGTETRPRNAPVLWCLKIFHPVRVPTPGPSGVNKAGDTMDAPLSGPAGTLSGHYVNLSQLDARNQMLVLEHVEAVGVEGGTNVAGAWTARKLAEQSNTITGATFDAGTYRATLPAGTYEVYASQSFYRAGIARSRIKSLSGSSVNLRGVDVYSSGSANTVLSGITLPRVITLSEATVIALEYRTSTVQATTGLGTSVSDGETGKFAELIIRRLA